MRIIWFTKMRTTILRRIVPINMTVTVVADYHFLRSAACLWNMVFKFRHCLSGICSIWHSSYYIRLLAHRYSSVLATNRQCDMVGRTCSFLELLGMVLR